MSDQIKIPLSKGRFATIDATDWDRVKEYRWLIDTSGYAYSFKGGPSGTNLMLHRFLLNLVKGDGIVVDHINGDRLDNRRSNLRPCTVAQNSRNRRRNATSQYAYKGVKKSGKTWRAYISVGGFETAEDAAAEYDRLALIAHGPFAQLNLKPNNGPTTQVSA